MYLRTNIFSTNCSNLIYIISFDSQDIYNEIPTLIYIDIYGECFIEGKMITNYINVRIREQTLEVNLINLSCIKNRWTTEDFYNIN